VDQLSPPSAKNVVLYRRDALIQDAPSWADDPVDAIDAVPTWFASLALVGLLVISSLVAIGLLVGLGAMVAGLISFLRGG
jgi:hypothetical protein